jgi:HlyD family type I secretion membrane fusion protein
MNVTSQDGIGRPLAAAGVVFGLCLGGLGLWSLQAPVASAVLAQGQIAVEGASKTVQHLEGGIVAEILAADGEAVRAGQPLLRLDVTETRAELAALTSEHEALSAQAARLQAELGGQAPNFAGIGSGSPTAAAAVAGQQALYEARAGEQAAEGEMLEGVLRRLEARRGAILAELGSVEAQLALTLEDAEANRALAERGVTTRAALRDFARWLAALRGAQASLTAQLAEAGAAEAEARLDRAGADTRRVSATSEELAKVVARTAEIRPALAALQDRLARARLRAPVSGTVVGMSVATIGGVIAPGEPLMRIVPESAVLVAQTRVRPADRERLAKGMRSEVRFPGVEAHGDTSLFGAVSDISADRVAGASAEQEDHYLMTIAIDQSAAASLVPGMPVTVVVPTAPRSVVDYLLSPIRDAIARSMREV